MGRLYLLANISMVLPAPGMGGQLISPVTLVQRMYPGDLDQKSRWPT